METLQHIITIAALVVAIIGVALALYQSGRAIWWKRWYISKTDSAVEAGRTLEREDIMADCYKALGRLPAGNDPVVSGKRQGIMECIDQIDKREPQEYRMTDRPNSGEFWKEEKP